MCTIYKVSKRAAEKSAARICENGLSFTESDFLRLTDRTSDLAAFSECPCPRDQLRTAGHGRPVYSREDKRRIKKDRRSEKRHV